MHVIEAKEASFFIKKFLAKKVNMLL